MTSLFEFNDPRDTPKPALTKTAARTTGDPKDLSDLHRLWKRARDACAGEFIDFMDKVSAEMPIAQSIDDLAQWKADVAAEKVLASH